MAIEYTKALQAMGLDVKVVGRGADSAESFTQATGLPVQTGGVEGWLKTNRPIPPKAIIAVGEMSLGRIAFHLLESGVNSLLVEKPGAATFQEICDLHRLAKERNAEIYVAYNRRFYSSVLKAREFIREDGGISSFHFEFTEWSHVVQSLQKEPGVKEGWFLHNSTHVIDLAFYLGGKPRKLSCYTTGGLDWHPAASVFSGAGISENGALFSYHANWAAPGRWSVECLTKQRRLIFRPLEKLQVQAIGTVNITGVDLDDKLDREFKPGLYRQIEAFMTGASENLCGIQEQAEMADVYSKMLLEACPPSSSSCQF